jgi:drug/metabolite transporter (DMT)-like permease
VAAARDDAILINKLALNARQIRQLSASQGPKKMPPSSAELAVASPNGAMHHDSPLLGMAAAAGAFFLLAVMTMFAKLLSGGHNVAEIAFWRNVIAFLPFLLLVFAFNRRDILTIKGRPRVLVIRSLVGTLNILFLFGAYALLPLADATALIFTSSLFVPLLGFFFLGERVGPYRWSAIVIGFIGVLFVAQPGGEWNALGVALGLTAAFLNAALGTMLRLLGRTETPETMTFYFLLIGALILLPAMPFIGKLPQPDEIGLFIGLGLSGSLMQFLLSTAFKYAPAALASVFNYTQIIWAVLFGWAVFGEWPALNILIGAAIIIASSLIVILRERYLARKGKLPRPPVAG